MFIRGIARAVAMSAALLIAPVILVAYANDSGPNEKARSNHSSFTKAVKHDTNVVGSSIKSGAHRVAVTSKAAAHGVARVAKRGVRKTQATFQGKKLPRPAS